MASVALNAEPSENPAGTLVSFVPVRLPEEMQATPERSATVLSPGSLLPKKKLPESELLLYVAAGFVPKTPPLPGASPGAAPGVNPPTPFFELQTRGGAALAPV